MIHPVALKKKDGISPDHKELFEKIKKNLALNIFYSFLIPVTFNASRSVIISGVLFRT